MTQSVISHIVYKQLNSLNWRVFKETILNNYKNVLKQYYICRLITIADEALNQ